MPYTKEVLQNLYALSNEEVNASLESCGLPLDKQEYSDDEIAGANFQQAAESVKQRNETTDIDNNLSTDNDSSNSSSDSSTKKRKKPKPIDITELLVKARDKDVKLTLSEAMQVLLVCGLEQKDEYSKPECDRFLEACQFIKQDGKSFEEVAQYFGVNTSNTHTSDSTDELLNQIGETTALLGEEERELIREMVRQKAKGDMSGLPKLYLQALLDEMKSPEFQLEWQQLREAFKDRIMGKKPASPLFPPPQPSISLPPTSENG